MDAFIIADRHNVEKLWSRTLASLRITDFIYDLWLRQSFGNILKLCNENSQNWSGFVLDKDKLAFIRYADGLIENGCASRWVA